MLFPGDPVRLMMGIKASPEAVEATRQRLGLDDPLPQQYASYMTKLVQGDLGRSIRYQTPVSELIAQFLPVTGFNSRQPQLAFQLTLLCYDFW